MRLKYLAILLAGLLYLTCTQLPKTALVLNPANEYTAPTITQQPNSVTVTEGQNAAFTVVASGNPVPSYQWQKNGSNISGALSAIYSLSSTIITDSGHYDVVVTNSQGTVTSSVVTLTVNPAILTAPSINTQPVAQTVTVGQPVTFTVTASGYPAPTYQWQKGGSNISGATSATYTISATVSGDAGSYAVVVTNSQGSVTSNAVTLTVNAALFAPIINTQPTSRTVTVGQSASFTVVASGNPTPNYQWQKGGSNISGATSATYTISATVSGDAGSYAVVVTNSQGSVTSSIITLTVNAAPIRIDSMVWITGGTFQMGSTLLSSEIPVHTVTVSGFWMSNTDVTQGEFQRVMGVNPSYFTGDLKRPVDSVTWFDAVLYCNKRSKMEGKDTVYVYTGVTGTPGDGCTDLAGITINYWKNGYRLPTEAEWHYACKAGTTTDFYWNKNYPPANSADTFAISNNCWWFLNSGNATHPVATKLPNAFNLFDMSGNVWEWVNDWYGSYTAGTQTDPTGPPPDDGRRVMCGGSWAGYDMSLRSANRFPYRPWAAFNYVGFRIVYRP